VSIRARSSGPWPVRSGPKVDDSPTPPPADGDDLAGRYEALRSAAFGEGVGRAGLGGALVMAQGVAAWMRGWRACAPVAPPPTSPGRTGAGPPAEVVGVLAAMALACVGGG
jgi:hypothetical protein